MKGSAITSRLRYVREHADEDVLREIKNGLSPENRDILEKGVLPHAWVPYSLYVELNVEADRVLGRGDLELCREMGRYGARVNLPTLYRIFLRMGSVPFMLRKAAKLWNVHYDSGSIDVEVLPGESARLTISDFDEPHRAHCLSVLGWAEGAAAITGASIVGAREESCRTWGDATCKLFLAWRS